MKTREEAVSKRLQKAESTSHLTGRASRASRSVLALSLPSVSSCLKHVVYVKRSYKGFWIVGLEWRDLQQRWLEQTWKAGTIYPHSSCTHFSLPSLCSSQASNLLYAVFNMLLSFQTSPASGFQPPAVYQGVMAKGEKHPFPTATELPKARHKTQTTQTRWTNTSPTRVS